MSTFHQGTVGTSILTWYNSFGHWSTQSAILGQNDQNAPGQPRVDRRSKLVKTAPKQHFLCFYIKPKVKIGTNFIAKIMEFSLQ